MPTEMSQCDALAEQWRPFREARSEAHNECLSAQGLNSPSGDNCTWAACEALHGPLQAANDQISRCRQQVREYERDMRRREQDEQRRQQELERQRKEQQRQRAEAIAEAQRRNEADRARREAERNDPEAERRRREARERAAEAERERMRAVMESRAVQRAHFRRQLRKIEEERGEVRDRAGQAEGGISRLQAQREAEARDLDTRLEELGSLEAVDRATDPEAGSSLGDFDFEALSTGDAFLDGLLGAGGEGGSVGDRVLRSFGGQVWETLSSVSPAAALPQRILRRHFRELVRVQNDLGEVLQAFPVGGHRLDAAAARLESSMDGYGRRVFSPDVFVEHFAGSVQGAARSSLDPGASASRVALAWEYVEAVSSAEPAGSPRSAWKPPAVADEVGETAEAGARMTGVVENLYELEVGLEPEDAAERFVIERDPDALDGGPRLDPQTARLLRVLRSDAPEDERRDAYRRIVRSQLPGVPPWVLAPALHDGDAYLLYRDWQRR